MGNKSKIVFTSAFACILGMAAIGCNNNVTPTIDEYKVTFTSNELETSTTVTSVKHNEDLNLSLSVKSAAKAKGFRLPNKETDKSSFKVTSGNAELTVDSTYFYDITGDVATLRVPHHSYAGDISIKVDGVQLFDLTDDRLVLGPVGYGDENVTVTIDAIPEYRAPDALTLVKIDGEDDLTPDYYFDGEVGKLTLDKEAVAGASKIEIVGEAVKDDSDAIPVYFYAPETGWDCVIDEDGTYFPNRPLLANMFTDKTPTVDAPMQDQYVHDVLSVGKDEDIDAVIELADWDETDVDPGDYIGDKWLKNYYYSHELPHGDVDREGIIEGFQVVGILSDGEEIVIPSNHYVYTPSDDFKSAFFYMDNYWLRQYPFARIDIKAEVEQVANNVIVNFGEDYDPDIVFNRHCYRYDSEILGEEDFVGNIDLVTEQDRRLPKPGDNARIELAMLTEDMDPDEPYLTFDQGGDFTYNITDSLDIRHQAALTIDRDSVTRPLPYDIVLTVRAVERFDVIQEGDLKHLDINPLTPLYQDEDLEVELIIDPADATAENDSWYYDYERTFKLPQDQDEAEDLITVYNQDGDSVAFTYEYTATPTILLPNLGKGVIKVDNADILTSTEIHIEAYAERTHFLAPFVAEDDDPITGRPYESDYIGYFLEEAALDGSLYIPVPSDPTGSITANVGLTLAGYNAEKKLTKHSLTDVYYEYGGNDEHEVPSEDIWYVDGDEEMSFEVRNSTSAILRQYKDIGTVTAKAPLDTSDPDGNFPAYNEDMLVWIYATPDTLVHDIVVYDDNPRTTPANSHYEITEINFNSAEVRKPTATEPWKWQWVEPITGDNPSITLTIKLKQQYIDEGYSLPVSTDPSVFIYTEELPSSPRYKIGLDEYGYVQWGRTQDNKGFVCNVTVNPTAPYQLSAICGSIEFDCWAPIPPATR